MIDTNALLGRVNQAALPDPEDEREVLNAPLLREVDAAIRELVAENVALKDAGEMLWVVVANASEGDWSKQSQDWQEAAARWRDNFFAVCKDGRLRGDPAGLALDAKNLLTQKREIALLRGILADCRPYLVSLEARLHECPLREGANHLWNLIDATLMTPGTPSGDATGKRS